MSENWARTKGAVDVRINHNGLLSVVRRDTTYIGKEATFSCATRNAI